MFMSAPDYKISFNYGMDKVMITLCATTQRICFTFSRRVLLFDDKNVTKLTIYYCFWNSEILLDEVHIKPVSSKSTTSRNV